MTLKTKITFLELKELIKFVEHIDYEMDDEFKTVYYMCQMELLERLKEKLNKSIDKIFHKGKQKEISLTLSKKEALIVLKQCSIIEIHLLKHYCFNLRVLLDNSITNKLNAQNLKEMLEIEQKNQFLLTK